MPHPHVLFLQLNIQLTLVGLPGTLVEYTSERVNDGLPS